MLKIMFNALESPIEIKSLTSIVIENKAIFSHIVQDMHNYENDNQTDVRIFAEDQKSLTHAEIVVIADIINYEINSASLLKVVYKDLENTISIDPEKKTEIEDLLGVVWSTINKEIIHFDINLEMESITLQGIFKALNIKVESNTTSIFEKTMDILHAFKYLPKKKVLVFINLGTYLSEGQIGSIKEYAALQNILVVLIDNQTFPISEQVVIDEDFVVMRRISSNDD